jgi:hypothetical protein
VIFSWFLFKYDFIIHYVVENHGNCVGEAPDADFGDEVKGEWEVEEVGDGESEVVDSSWQQEKPCYGRGEEEADKEVSEEEFDEGGFGGRAVFPCDGFVHDVGEDGGEEVGEGGGEGELSFFLEESVGEGEIDEEVGSSEGDADPDEGEGAAVFGLGGGVWFHVIMITFGGW